MKNTCSTNWKHHQPNGRIWNAGPNSLGRLYPVVMAAKSDIVRDVMTWGDADNQQVKLSMPEL
ncbi:Hypothetical protein Asd1617_02704 [Shigella dysenteriae 1617]|uniref:Uncharacterized protein n=1 Tax=Shigella dysenteriae 1617 TaxID=754093 RepID=A0A0A6ZV50_SHIDY|nr:Hypothetical protein Asd1617_02704 [Shigella dysenteriae 1617]